MKPEEQRAAIAEACGWVWYRMPFHKNDGERQYRCLFHPAIHEYEGQSPEWLVRADGTENICNWKYMEDNGHVPDYLNSLDAMHDAESIFDDKPIDVKSLYWDYLALVSMPEPFPGDDTFLRDYVMIRATAKQRAEAFLRTINKWRGD